ncbi:hypothetical protein D3C78_1189070 [compost metagenome]
MGAKECSHFFLSFNAIPHCCIFSQFLYLDSCIFDSLNRVSSTKFSILVSWFAFQHYVLENTITVLIRFRVCLPVINNQLAGHCTGFFCFSAYIINFIPFLHIFRKRFAVKKYHWNVCCFCFFDNDASSCTVNWVNQHPVIFFSDE